MLIRDRNIDPNDAAVINEKSITFVTAINLTNAVVRLFKATQHAVRVLAAEAYARAVTATISLDLAIADEDGLIVGTTLAISATAEKFKTTVTTAVYLAAGVVKTKAATDNLVFSAADTINTAGAAGKYWGAWLVEIDAAGAVATKPAQGLADQVYATEAEAIAGLPAHTAGKAPLGYITVQSKEATKWTANTDDMTAASDCTAANFYSGTPRKPLSGAITPLALETVAGTVDDTNLTDVQAELDEYIAVIMTTDGTGAATDLSLTLHTRAGRVYRGE